MSAQPSPPPPDLNIPSSSSTVDVSIINTNHSIKGLPTSIFFGPSIKGHETMAAPIYSFLIQHARLHRTIIFDLGIRKDWEKLAPIMTRNIDTEYVEIDVPKSVKEILEEDGRVDVDAGEVESVVWSHWHLDHSGGIEEFPKSTSLIVGPGVRENFLPGYPAKEDSPILESDLRGRELVQLEFSPESLKIGTMHAIDYFGDGSLYFLNAPGHAIGHVCALARVTAEPASFVLMGGDAWHHSAELRPSRYLPLPEEISPHPFTSLSNSVCPGSMFEASLRDGDRAKPFYVPEGPDVRVHFDPEEAGRTIEKLQEVDPRDDVLMAAAHDESLMDVVEFFPEKANEFRAKGWVRQARWRFLRDFAEAVGFEGEVQGRRNWAKTM